MKLVQFEDLSGRIIRINPEHTTIVVEHPKTLDHEQVTSISMVNAVTWLVKGTPEEVQEKLCNSNQRQY